MKKKSLLMLILLMFSLVLFACSGEEEPTEQQSIGFDDPFSPDIYIPTSDLEHISPVPDEYTIQEDFDAETLNQTPRNWYLYTNNEYGISESYYEGSSLAYYVPQEVLARTVGDETNQYVEMYSAGVHAPMYPQGAPTPTFIFTAMFNLDQDRAGVAYGSLMVSSDKHNNKVTLGVSSGSVTTISVTIEENLDLTVKVGGPFFYYSGTADAGDTYDTDYTLSKDTWYSFKFEWQAATDFLAAYLLVDDTYVLLWQGNFHISSRVNALETGTIMVPNVVRVTMPRYQEGWAYLDDINVERWGDAS